MFGSLADSARYSEDVLNYPAPNECSVIIMMRH
jgi:hypothetical protein